MPWLLLFFAFAALAVAFKTTSTLLMALCLLIALGLALVAVMQLLAARLEGSTRNEALMIDPVEMRRLREDAEARKLAAAQANNPSIEPNREAMP